TPLPLLIPLTTRGIRIRLDRSFQIEIAESDTYNVLELKFHEHYTARKVRAFLTGNTMLNGFSSSSLVKAVYSPTFHQILITAAHLQPPAISPSFPASFNYGSLAAAIGRNVAFSLGAFGYANNTLRDYLKTLDKEDIDLLTERIQCKTVDVGNWLHELAGISISIRAFDAYQEKKRSRCV
ncbi:hypothetical protein PFISCL1PPCAC_4095, partial [Pristionchus fissidentatus]